MSEHLQSEFLTAFDAYNDAIFRFCMSKTGNRDASLDITQDTFMRTWEYLAAGNTVDNLRALLYRIARNLIIDRARKKKTTSLDHILEAGIEFTSAETHDEIIGKFDLKKSLTLLNQLDEKYREPLLMKHIDGLSITEIAEILDETANTISVRIHRAVKQAKVLYETTIS